MVNNSAWIFDATIENFQETVIDRSAQVPVVIDVWASWCAPCKQLMPILEKLANDYAGGFVLAKVNADEQQTLVAQLGVKSLPTVFLLHEGRLTDHFGGALPESEVRKWLSKHIASAPVDPRVTAAALESEGQLDAALALLLEQHQKTPDDLDLLIEVASLKLKLGHIEEVAPILAGLPDEKKRLPKVKQIQASLDYAAKAPSLPALDRLLSLHNESPDDAEVLMQLGQKKLVLGMQDEGIGHLFDCYRQDTSDSKRRQHLLEAFELLGADHVLTRSYRRKLYALLH